MQIETVRSINIEEQMEAFQTHPLDNESGAEGTGYEPNLKDFVQYCQLNNITERSQLVTAPWHIQILLEQP